MEETMPEGALLNRHRDTNGKISKKHGSTLVSTLRNIYGRNFARGLRRLRKAQRRAAQIG
jgi:hypothetical protein